ncbi:pentatricopeptide repeat-containing protein At3g13160, mitochondrial-like [Juglans microcarpa x Juglans regia]|uniref:pentatricopeptide repeat-containing protein At3g13160, mitochondrial-like n=1 Tax=Juglans microcarpa x Juglans regia TaxID=2249226 RepID=UPI001B7E89A3|nr:pentatricopeptide repeat-containing protein At3g13160, mitochondrial-like [Juglans microcarpa x Juglans regia]
MWFSGIVRRSFTTVLQPESTTSIKSIANDLYRERSLELLVHKFKKFSELSRFRTRAGIYEDTVRRLAKAKHFRWIEEILEDQKKYEDISKEGFTVRLISLYGKSGMFYHAKRVFDEMPERSCSQTVLSFNALLGACLNSKKFDLVNELFKELPMKLSIEPDLVSYNTAIKAFCHMGWFDSAVSMLDELETHGVEPDLFTFNTLLNGLYGKGRFLDGENTWDRMKKKNIDPDIRSYNAKLIGLASQKKTKVAVELMEEMKTREVKPNSLSFNAVIEGYVNEGNLEEAKWWYDNIGERKGAPGKRTFEIVVPYICEKGELGLAFELCKEIFRRSFLVDVSLLQLVVDGLVMESKMKEAKKLAQLGKTNSYCRYDLTLPSVV